MNLMSRTPHREKNKHNTNRNRGKCQPRFHIRKLDIQHEQLHTKPDKEEEIEFKETSEDFVVEIVAVDFSVGAETFEDEPAKVFVDAVGEVGVCDLRDACDAGDYD